MLQYLIKLTDNTLVVAIVMALLLYLGLRAAGGGGGIYWSARLAARWPL